MMRRGRRLVTPAPDPHPPEPLLASIFLGAPTLVLLWSFIGMTAVLLAVIHAFDPKQCKFGFPESDASDMVRIACGIGLWAAFSIRFACSGVMRQKLPRAWLVIVLIPLLVLAGPVGWIVILAVVRTWLSRLRPGKLRASLLVAIAAPCAVLTLLGVEFAVWLLLKLLPALLLG